MTRLQKAATIIALALCFAVAVAGELWEASHPPASPRQSTTAEQQHSAENKTEKKSNPNRNGTQSLWVPTDSIGLYTLVLSVFTAILATATISLGVLNFLQIRLARAEFLSTHRPKIRLKHIWLNSDIWDGEEIIVSLVVVNTGTAEARLQEVGIRYEIVREGEMLPAAPDIAAVVRANAPLRSGFNYRFPLLKIGRVLTAAENVAVQGERSELFCVGYISYLDAANRMRITGFCRVLTFPPDALIRAENSRFRKFDDPDYEYED